MNKIKYLKVVAKPTQNCNFNCEYCYNKKVDKSTDMDIEMIERIAQFAANSAENIYWVWHGGEPLLMGVDFYKEAKKILDKYGVSYVCVQTNGSLLSDEFIKFFHESDWSVSISYDGSSQKTKRNNSDIVSKNIDRMYELTGKKTNVAKVVDGDTVDTISIDYDLLKEKGSVGYLTLLKVFNLDDLGDDLKIIEGSSADKYIKQFADLFDKWINDENPLKIRNFEELFPFLFNGRKYSCEQSGRCHEDKIGIYPNGDLYTCVRCFPVEYSYGNINDYDSFQDMAMNSEIYKEFKGYVLSREKYCKEELKCKYSKWCNGGCIATSICNGTPMTPDFKFCKILELEINFIFNYLMNCDISKIKNPESRKTLENLGFRNLKFIKETINNIEK